MDWMSIKPVLNSPTSTIKEKFEAEQKYWNEASPILVGPLKKEEFKKFLTEAIDKIVDINSTSIKLLDFGCGIGRVYNTLSPQCQYTGIDISEGYLNIFKKEHPELNLIKIDQQEIPISDNTFDIIICYSVFTHIPAGDQCALALSELYRVLKPQGILLVSVFQDVKAAPTCNWTTYTTDYWKTLITSQNWKEHKITLCYECVPQVCQSLYTLVK